MAKKRTAADWAELVERWRRSGLAGPKFARSAGVTIEQLRWWKWRLQKNASMSGVAPVPAMVRVEVRSPDRTPESASTIEVTRSGWTIRIGRGFDAETLDQVLDAIAARPC